MSKTVKLVTTDEEKAEVLNKIFASVFPHLSSGWTTRRRLGEQSPSQRKRRSGSWSPEELEHT